MKKIALVTFNGEEMCFVHALINALDLEGRGHEVRLVIEGQSTALIGGLDAVDNPFGRFYREVRDKGLIHGICKACANKMGSLEEAKRQGLTLLDGLYGHPAMGDYLEEGFEIITF